jgi:uncharacterized protein
VPTDALDLGLLYALVLAAAVLYSSGGHAGATAYLAIMAWFAFAPAAMRPTALVMNIGVALIGSARFTRAKAVPWPLLMPLLGGSIPMAFLGGRMKLSPGTYLLLLGSVLLLAAAFLWLRPPAKQLHAAPHRFALVALGAALGLLSGMTGIGGGIFLSPILILSGWADPRFTSGAAAVFILLNSMLGLAGQYASAAAIPPQALTLALVAMAGGLFGSWLAVHRLQPLVLRRVHAVVVLASGGKLLLEGLKASGLM